MKYLLPLGFLGLGLAIACGNPLEDTSDVDTGSSADPECAYDLEIRPVCDCLLTVSWADLEQTVTEVVLITYSLTAKEVQAGACADSLRQSDVQASRTIPVDAGTVEISLDAIVGPSVIALNTASGLLKAVIVIPSGNKSANTVIFE